MSTVSVVASDDPDWCMDWEPGMEIITSDGVTVHKPSDVCHCGRAAYEQYSLGIYAGRYCDECWDKSGYRKEGASGFDPLDAGEHYDVDDY